MIDLNYNKKFIFSILIIGLLLSFQSFAEYRVYQYLVSPTYPIPQDGQSFIVTSTLHPKAYETYHGGSESIKVDLLRSWICKGFTGDKKEFCKSPLSEALKTNVPPPVP